MAVAADAAGGVTRRKARLRVRLDATGAGVAGGVRAGRAGVRDVVAGNPTLKQTRGGGTDGPVWKEYQQTGLEPAGALRRLFVWSEELEAEASGGDARPVWHSQAGSIADRRTLRFVVTNVKGGARKSTDGSTVSRGGEPSRILQGGGGDATGHEFLMQKFRSCAALPCAGVAVAGSGDPLRQDAGGRAATVPVEAGGVGEDRSTSGGSC